MRYTYKQFQADYPDNDTCLQLLFDNRFRDKKFCKGCGAETKFYKIKKRQCYSCMHCGYQIHPLAGTIFHKSSTPLVSWFHAIYLFSVSKNGVSSKELERHLGVTYKTAWRMAKQIRLLMKQDESVLSGVVEADETYWGGRRPQARVKENKTAILGIVEKQGRLKAISMPQATSVTVLPYLNEYIELGTILHTDESHIYKFRAKDYFDHKTVNHGVNTYVHDGVHTNNLEGFWSQLKRSIHGTYHSISPKYLPNYLDEFVFRYNYRNEIIFPVLLKQATQLV